MVAAEAMHYAFRVSVMAEYLPEPEKLRIRWLKDLERGSREVGQG